jgi:hypothetical protein
VLGGIDDTSPEADIVVAIDGVNGTPGVCSGVLLTPTIVLTTRTCVGPAKAGSAPVVRVGSSLATAKTYQSVGSVVQGVNPGDLASTTASGDLAIVYLDAKYPAFDNVAIPHQSFIAPPSVPGSATGDGSQVYENIGVSGWAPAGATQGVRKQVTFDAVSLISQFDPPMWLRNRPKACSMAPASALYRTSPRFAGIAGRS